MQANDSTAEKRIVEELTFGVKTTKRVTWEAWEFTVVGPHLVEVCNVSYGHLKDDHTYTVGVEVRNGLALPAECECPADVHHEPDCKHKVALATVGGPTVLEAAVAYEPSPLTFPGDQSGTVAEKLQTDGGAMTQREGDNCTCVPEFPCFECYRTGNRVLP